MQVIVVVMSEGFRPHPRCALSGSPEIHSRSWSHVPRVVAIPSPPATTSHLQRRSARERLVAQVLQGRVALAEAMGRDLGPDAHLGGQGQVLVGVAPGGGVSRVRRLTALAARVSDRRRRAPCRAPPRWRIPRA